MTEEKDAISITPNKSDQGHKDICRAMRYLHPLATAKEIGEVLKAGISFNRNFTGGKKTTIKTDDDWSGINARSLGAKLSRMEKLDLVFSAPYSTKRYTLAFGGAKLSGLMP